MAGLAYAAGKKIRKAAVGGIAVLGAGVLLSACSTTQMGAAAIVGNQRITQADLNTQVNALSKEAAAAHLNLPADKLPNAVLTNLISFKILHQTAQSKGISVTPAKAQEALQNYEEYAMQQTQAPSAKAALLNIGISSKMQPAFSQALAEQAQLQSKLNGGKLPSTQAEETAVETALSKAQCASAKSLNIKVNPQFGQLAYSQGVFGVAATTDLLSRASTSTAPPSPAPTTLAC